MKSFTSEKVGRTFVIRLEKGDLLRESIEELSKKEKIKNAVVISGIANH